MNSLFLQGVAKITGSLVNIKEDIQAHSLLWILAGLLNMVKISNSQQPIKDQYLKCSTSQQLIRMNFEADLSSLNLHLIGCSLHISPCSDLFNNFVS